MKSLYAVLGVVSCVVMMTACATDDPSTTADQQPSEVTEMGTIMYVPPELSFEQPAGTFMGNQFVAAAGCHVTLLFCRDSRFGNLPSFCQNGGCGGAQGASIARDICLSVCGNINCNTLVQVLPNRPGC